MAKHCQDQKPDGCGCGTGLQSAQRCFSALHMLQGTLRNMGCLSTQPHLQLFARSLQYISMILVFEKFKTVLTLPHRSMAFFCFCLICLNTFHWCFLRSNWPRRRHSDGPCIRDSEIMFRIFWIVSNVSCQFCRDEIASFMSYLYIYIYTIHTQIYIYI